jgi:hypothetical protein
VRSRELLIVGIGAIAASLLLAVGGIGAGRMAGWSVGAPGAMMGRPSAVGMAISVWIGRSGSLRTWLRHFRAAGKLVGMVSVNGYTGQVWYHSWHGTSIQLEGLGA